MTTYFTILLIHIAATTYTVTLLSQAECSDALLIISDARHELSDMAGGGETWAQCHRTNLLSASMRPKARGDL